MAQELSETVDDIFRRTDALYFELFERIRQEAMREIGKTALNAPEELNPKEEE